MSLLRHAEGTEGGGGAFATGPSRRDSLACRQLMVKGLSRHSHFDLLWMQSSKEGFGLAKKRGLNDIPGGDALNPEQISKLRTKGEGKKPRKETFRSDCFCEHC